MGIRNKGALKRKRSHLNMMKQGLNWGGTKITDFGGLIFGSEGGEGVQGWGDLKGVKIA